MARRKGAWPDGRGVAGVGAGAGAGAGSGERLLAPAQGRDARRTAARLTGGGGGGDTRPIPQASSGASGPSLGPRPELPAAAPRGLPITLQLRPQAWLTPHPNSHPSRSGWPVPSDFFTNIPPRKDSHGPALEGRQEPPLGQAGMRGAPYCGVSTLSPRHQPADTPHLSGVPCSIPGQQ